MLTVAVLVEREVEEEVVTVVVCVAEVDVPVVAVAEVVVSVVLVAVVEQTRR